MNFNKETIYNLGIGGASEIRLRELIHQLRADWIEMNEELTRLKKAHSASPNANTVLGVPLPSLKEIDQVADDEAENIDWDDPDDSITYIHGFKEGAMWMKRKAGQ